MMRFNLSSVVVFAVVFCAPGCSARAVGDSGPDEDCVPVENGELFEQNEGGLWCDGEDFYPDNYPHAQTVCLPNQGGTCEVCPAADVEDAVLSLFLEDVEEGCEVGRSHVGCLRSTQVPESCCFLVAYECAG